jgi:hypothetical protein
MADTEYIINKHMFLSEDKNQEGDKCLESSAKKKETKKARSLKSLLCLHCIGVTPSDLGRM